MDNNPNDKSIQPQQMSPETKRALSQAKKHIQAKEWADARNILEPIEHPIAKKWLSQFPDYDPFNPDKAKSQTKTRFNQARALIKAKKYDEARDILESLDHPKAQTWLDKIDELDIFGSGSGQPHTTEVIVNQAGGPGCVVQFLWFWFIGWWMAQFAIAIAWFSMATIIGIPLGIYIINRISQIIALRSPNSKQQTRVTVSGNNTRVEINGGANQLNIIIRILYFFFIGWWLSAIWMEFAYFFCLIIIGFPLGFWMFDKTPAVLTLQRS